MTCTLCEVPFRECKIKELKHWDVYVHPNQAYLGRGIFVLRRHANKDNLTVEEMDELARAQEAYLKMVKNDFKPDQIDESWELGEHTSFEFIPRYKSFRIQNGAEFNDAKFGQPWQPAPEWELERAAKAFVIKMLVMRFRQPFLTVG